MRSSTWTILAFLAAGLALLTYMSYGPQPLDPVAPGQYPIWRARPEWPVAEVVKSYRPGAVMGSDAALIAGAKDEKARCALSPSCRV